MQFVLTSVFLFFFLKPFLYMKDISLHNAAIRWYPAIIFLFFNCIHHSIRFHKANFRLNIRLTDNDDNTVFDNNI